MTKITNGGATKLLPCPFCGGKRLDKTFCDMSPVIKCASCGAMMTIPASFVGNFKIELERKWNTRKPMQEILERLEEQYGVKSYDEEDVLISYEQAYIHIDEAIEIVKEVGGLDD